MLISIVIFSQEAGQAIPGRGLGSTAGGHCTCRCLQHRTYKCLKEIEKENNMNMHSKEDEEETERRSSFQASCF